MNRPLPTPQQLEEAYKKIADIHRRHLQQHRVKLPRKESYKWVWLAMLQHYDGDKVHKDEISRAVRRAFPDAGHDQQVRHLKRDGWNITGKGGWHTLADPYSPSPDYINELARRRGRLEATDFEDIKIAFGGKCATCGAVEGEPDPRYGKARVVLEQGHQNPDAPSDDPKNIIPQCQFCNRTYRRDFTFDDKGRVRAVADIGPVQRASYSVQKKIWEFLKSKFGNGT